jgi:Helix-turn-helix domain
MLAQNKNGAKQFLALVALDCRAMADDEVLTLGDIAAEKGLAPATVRNWVATGKLPAHKDPDDPRRWLAYRSDLEKFLGEASRLDIGRPKPRGSNEQIEHDGWSGTPDDATLNIVNAHRSGKAADGAVVSPRVAYDQLLKSDQSWAEAIHGFNDYPARLRALADAADLRSRTLMMAHLANFPSNPRPGASKLPGLAKDLYPGKTRPGPSALWKRFDAAVQALLVALEAGELPPLAAAFGALTPIANELADACEQEESRLEQAG